MKNTTITQAQADLRAKKYSARELCQYYLNNAQKNRDLNVFITETPELALKMADESDKRIGSGNAKLLDGITIAVKDLYCTNGVKTTAGSKILHNFVPQYESTITNKLWQQGAIMVGKANLDEFAMGSSNLTSHFGAVINPWREKARPNKQLVPGGSSGGSAAAVAADLALTSLGTDTGGSIRQPASFCGLVGIKPTYGRCSRFGIIAFASSLDQAGPFARSVADSAIMLGAMAGFDENDSTSAQMDVPNWLGEVEKAQNQGIKGKIIGIPKEYALPDMPKEISDAWEKGKQILREAGAIIKEISLPHTHYALSTYYIIAPAEASSNLARYDGVRYGLRVPAESLDELYAQTRSEGFGDEVKRRIMIGTFVLSSGYYDAYYLKAQKMRTKIADDFKNAFKECQAILTPTAPSSAFAIDEKPTDPVAMYMCDVFTVPASIAGLPCGSVPIGLDSKGLPLGLQVIGAPFDESQVLQTMASIEKSVGFLNPNG